MIIGLSAFFVSDRYNYTISFKAPLRDSSCASPSKCHAEKTVAKLFSTVECFDEYSITTEGNESESLCEKLVLNIFEDNRALRKTFFRFRVRFFFRLSPQVSPLADVAIRIQPNPFRSYSALALSPQRNKATLTLID